MTDHTPEPDSVREAFEGWAKPLYFPYVKTQFKKNGTYSNKLVQAAYIAWQANRVTTQSRITSLEAECDELKDNEIGLQAALSFCIQERDEARARVASLQDVIEQLIACHDEPTCPALDVARAALSATPAESSTTKETP